MSLNKKPFKPPDVKTGEKSSGLKALLSWRRCSNKPFSQRKEGRKRKGECRKGNERGEWKRRSKGMKGSMKTGKMKTRRGGWREKIKL